MTKAEQMNHRGQCLDMAVRIHEPISKVTEFDKAVNVAHILNTADRLFKFITTGKIK